MTQLGKEKVLVRKTLALLGMEPSTLVDEMVTLAVQCLIWSGFAVDRLVAGHPLRPDLEAIAEEAHVTDLGADQNVGGDVMRSEGFESQPSDP